MAKLRRSSQIRHLCGGKGRLPRSPGGFRVGQVLESAFRRERAALAIPEAPIERTENKLISSYPLESRNERCGSRSASGWRRVGEAHRILRKQPRFAIEIDVVAIVPDLQVRYADWPARRIPPVKRSEIPTGSRYPACDIQACRHLRCSARHQFLPRTQQIHISFGLSGNRVEHTTR